MAASRCCRRLCLAVCLGASSLHAQERAELTFLLDSDNVLGSEEAPPPPWETLDGFRSGRDNRARLAFGTERPGSIAGLTTSALLRLDLPLFDAGQESALRVRDASSWLELAWQRARQPRLWLRAFPLDTDYLRLGYAHALDWGGTDVSRRESVFLRQSGGAPGIGAGLSARAVRLFSWLKSAELKDDVSGSRRVWGGAVGGSVDLAEPLRIDAGFGFFQRPPTFLEGASLRVVVHRGPREPELATEPFRPASFEDAPERLSAEAPAGCALALEGVTLLSRQRRYEDPSLPVTTLAPAAALSGSLRSSRWSAHFLLSWRSLPFVLRNDPRLLPEDALPASASWRAELGGFVGGSYAALSGRLVPAFELGLRLPAALLSVPSDGGGAETFIVGGVAGFEALPRGSGIAPLVAARVSLRLQASASHSISLISEYERDPNRSTFVTTSPTRVMRQLAPVESLLLRLAVQARF